MKKTSKKMLDIMYPHRDNCGHCALGRLMETILIPVVRNPKSTKDQIQEADKQLWKVWKDSKYVKLVEECQKKGISWQVEFEKRGWEP